MRTVLAVVVGFCACSAGAVLWAQPPGPAMEFHSVLDGLDVFHRTGQLQVQHDHPLVGAFIPPDAAVDFVITKRDSDVPLIREPLRVQPLYGSFQWVSTRNVVESRLTVPGDYVAKYQVNGQPVTEVPFTLFTQSDGDDFDPKTFYYLKGPWDNWACLYAPLEGGQDARPEFRMWARKVSFVEGRDADRYTIEIRRGSDVIATGGQSFVSSQEWLGFQFRLSHPADKGGTALTVADLYAIPGTYHVVIKRNDEPYAVHQYDVQDGRAVPHARQGRDYQPRTEYLVPRYAGDSPQAQGAGNLIWIERLADEEAATVLSGNNPAVKGGATEDRRRWQWRPTVDPKRSFALAITDIETRNDTFLDVGNEIVAYGTGYPHGVAYFRVGEETPREVPGGDEYSSTVFRVCGRKIAFVKGKSVVIFDTDSGRRFPIPEDEIALYDVRGGLHTANLLHADGYLIATVNDVTKVRDRTVLKVIDVSGDTPIVIPVKNAGYTHSDVSSVTVSASQAAVAVSSSQRNVVAVAMVSPNAAQRVFALDEQGGVGRRQMFFADDAVVYADTDDRVRYLPLQGKASAVLTDDPIGRSGNGFYVSRGRMAVATSEKLGTRFQFAVCKLPERPIVIPGTGAKIDGTSGALGMAGCAAITDDGTVFLAGTPSGGIGVGEHLQVLDSKSGVWRPLYNRQGQVISAIDVTTSTAVMAFKAGDRRTKTTIGYAIFGERIDVGRLPISAEIAQASPAMLTPGTPPVSPSDTPAPPKLTDQDKEFLQTYVETERELRTALSEAFGEAAGKMKARQAVLDAMKRNKHEHLVAPYLKMFGEGP